VIISGDIHASFVTDHGADGDGNRVLEMTGPAVTSTTFSEELRSVAYSNPALASPQAMGLVNIVLSALDSFLMGADPTVPINFVYTKQNGVVSVKIDGSSMTATYSLLVATENTTDQTADPATLLAKVQRKTLTVTKTGGKNSGFTIT